MGAVGGISDQGGPVVSRLQGHSLDWAGDMVASPHGDWFHRSDVQRLQDELEAALKALKDAKAEVAQASSVAPRTDLPGKLFGFVNPDEVRRYKSGRQRQCRVVLRESEAFNMPLLNLLPPNHYQKPSPGTVVMAWQGAETGTGPQAVVFGHHPDGIIVKYVDGDGSEQLLTKWVWRR